MGSALRALISRGSLAAVTRRSRHHGVVDETVAAELGRDRGREVRRQDRAEGCKQPSKAFPRRESAPTGSRQIGCRGVEGTVCSDGASIASQMSVGGEESPESGSSDTNGLQPCCALFLAIPAGRSGQSRVRIRRLFCFGPPWRVAPAPDGRRLTHSNVGRALEMPETGYGGTTRLAASPIRQPWRRASRKGLSVRTLALVSASLTSRPAQAGTPGRR